MKKFDRHFKIGTQVLINETWCKIIEIHETRNWVKVDKWAGFFQRGHILKYKRNIK
jgi:hypothetical protein